MEQLTKNQAVATSQEAVQNQNEPQLRDENAHNDKSVHGVLNPTYQAGLRRDAVQPDIEAERKKRDEIEAGKSYCSRRFGGATCDDKSAQIYARFDKNDWRIQPTPTYQRRAPLRLPLVPRNGCGRPGRAPERFLPLDITSLLLHVIFDARFLLRQ